MSWVRSSRIQHPDDIRNALGFSGEPTGFDLVRLYGRAKMMDAGYNRNDLRIAWKLADDPFYWQTFKHYQNLQTVVDAGFFDDGLEPGVLKELTDLHWLTTPLDVIRDRLIRLEEEGRIHDRPLVVALTSGCFAPAHDGHIAMMREARLALEETGHEVVGGFFSPSHDDYVSTKGSTPHEQQISRQLTAAHRIYILERILEESDWLSVDPWGARYTPTDINFTDCILRLENYINAHLNSIVPIRVAYVFGADHMPFARTFVAKGLAVCVGRPGYDDKVEQFFIQSGLKDNPHIIVARSSAVNISSSQVRQMQAPSSARIAENTSYQELLKGQARQASSVALTNTYLIRDDLRWATDSWRNKVGSAILDSAREEFMRGLVRNFENAFELSRAPGYPEKIEAVLLSVENQLEEAQKLMEIAPERVINNDAITGDAPTSLGLSRLFKLSESQLTSKGLISRPGRQDMKRLFGRLPKGAYTVVDDDIATGSTIRMMEQQLPNGVTFDAKIALSERAFKRAYPDREYAFWDIVDARDFLLGARCGGLVVQLFNGEVGRAPYMLPYTSLVNRAKIPPDQEMRFTAEILRLNRRFFRRVMVDLRLEDTDPQFQRLMKTIGFREKKNLSELCAWHETHLHLIADY